LSYVNNINPLNNSYQKIEEKEDIKKSKPDSEKVKNDSTGLEKTGKIASDRAEISQAAKTLYEYSIKNNKYKELFQKKNLLDQNEIQKIKEKIESNFYNQDNVLNKVAESLLALPTFSKIIQKHSPDKVNQREREEKLAKTKEKIENKEYEKDEVIDKLAEKIIQQIRNSQI